MPFVRLLAIYALVAIAITAYFNRDKIAMLVSGPEAEEIAAEPVVEPVVEVAAAAPVADAVPAPQPVVEQQPVYQPPVAQPQPPIASPVADDFEAERNAARKAFWDGDREQAEQLYLVLTRDHPFEADLWGELGNLYYGTGRIDEAAQSYHSAGSVALQAGDLDHARNIIGFLQGLDRDKAEELRNLLEVITATRTE